MQRRWIGGLVLSAAELASQAIASRVPATPQGELFRVPVHAARDGADGLWTAGPTYKARFTDGSFTFYPCLGASCPGNRPWTWRTRSVEFGGQRLRLAPSTMTHTDWRVELRSPDVTERYDVCPEGIEQSFVIHRRPAVPGELRIRGRVTTDLVADRPEVPGPRQRELCFRDAAGTELVRYGEAWAVDAAGRRTAVATDFDGSEVTLRLGSAWLREATFPVVVDPLTSRQLRSTGSGRIGALDITASCGLEAVIYTRQFSATDHDAYVRRITSDGSSSDLVFSSLDPASDVRSVAATYDGRSRFVFAMTQFESGPGIETLLVYFHDANSNVFNSGVARRLATPQRHYRNVDLGGMPCNSLDGDDVLLVYELATVGQSSAEVYGRLLDVRNRLIGLSAFLLAPSGIGTTIDRRNPTVSSKTLDLWTAVWEEQGIRTPDDVDLHASQISATGTRLTTATLVDGSEGGGGNALCPRIDGAAGKLVLAYLESGDIGSRSGERLYSRRVQWSQGGAPAVGARRLVDSAPLAGSLSAPELCFDFRNFANWGLVYLRHSLTASTLRIARLGYTGGVTENVAAFSGSTVRPLAPAIVFNEGRNRFESAWGSSASSGAEPFALYTQGMEYSPDATSVNYGASCSTARSFSSHPPYAGRERQVITMTDAAASQPCALLLSLGRADLSLDTIGMASCRLLVDPSGGTLLASLAAVTDALGSAAHAIPLSDQPLFLGDLFAQWIYVDPEANALGVSTTVGLRLEVR